MLPCSICSATVVTDLGKSWKVLEFYSHVFRAWKVLESGLGPWKSWNSNKSPWKQPSTFEHFSMLYITNVRAAYHFGHRLQLTFCIVVWPTMSCFGEWSKRRHVTLSIIIYSLLHGHPGWHCNVSPDDVTWRSLNENVRYILHFFVYILLVFLFVSYCKFLLNTV